MATENRNRFLALLLIATLIALAVSGLRPYDRVTWLLEVAPVVIALPILLATRHNFPLTTLLYVLIFAHALVLILGGAYTYARVPLGAWVQQTFELSRNPYDKLGHFMQGFVPAMCTRDPDPRQVRPRASHGCSLVHLHRARHQRFRTSWSSGGLHSRSARAPTNFSERRATRGIRSPTC